MFELGRLLGLRTWICELGGLRVYDGGDTQVLERGSYPGEGRPADALAVASEGLSDAFATLEPHDPWNEGREVSLLLRGDIDMALEINKESVDFFEGAARFRRVSSIQPFYIPLVFNLRNPILARPAVRRREPR